MEHRLHFRPRDFCAAVGRVGSAVDSGPGRPRDWREEESISRAGLGDLRAGWNGCIVGLAMVRTCTRTYLGRERTNRFRAREAHGR